MWRNPNLSLSARRIEWSSSYSENPIVPYDSAVPVSGMYPRELRTHLHRTCTQMFAIALSNPNIQQENIGVKAWYNRLMEYCSTTKWPYGSIFKEMLRIGESTETGSRHVVAQERSWQRKWEEPLAGVMFALKQWKAVFMMVAQFFEFTKYQWIVCILSVEELGGVWISI